MKNPFRFRPFIYPPELSSSARIGGKISGPKPQGTINICSGRPPVLALGDKFHLCSLVLSSSSSIPATIGSTVTVDLECSNAFGGITNRTFEIGQGLSAQLQVGSFAHINCKARAPLAASQDIFYSWIASPVNTSHLFKFATVVAGTSYNLPEGCVGIIPDQACTATFQAPQFGTTFDQVASAGQEIEAIWGAVSFNNTMNVVYKLRGL